MHLDIKNGLFSQIMRLLFHPERREAISES